MVAENANYEDDGTWMVDYSMKFQSCHAINTYEQDGMRKEIMVKFRMCKKCGYGCRGGDYLVDMNEFVNSYTESKMNEFEYKCEQQRETCEASCQYYYGDDDVCQSNCFTKAGMSSCLEDEEASDDGYEFNLQEYLECRQIENKNNNYYMPALYVGPKCSSNGEKINLALFTDETCTKETSSALYAKYMGGHTLPYTKESIVAEDCIACATKTKNDNGYYEVEYKEICQESVENAVRCEKNMDKTYPDTSGCEYMAKLYLRQDNYDPIKHSTAVAFAWIFFVSTVGLGALSYHLYTKKGNKVNLAGNDYMAGGAVV